MLNSPLILPWSLLFFAFLRAFTEMDVSTRACKQMAICLHGQMITIKASRKPFLYFGVLSNKPPFLLKGLPVACAQINHTYKTGKPYQMKLFPMNLSYSAHQQVRTGRTRKFQLWLHPDLSHSLVAQLKWKRPPTWTWANRLSVSVNHPAATP